MQSLHCWQQVVEEGLLLRVCIFMHVGSICFINVRRYK